MYFLGVWINIAILYHFVILCSENYTKTICQCNVEQLNMFHRRIFMFLPYIKFFRIKCSFWCSVYTVNAVCMSECMLACLPGLQASVMM